METELAGKKIYIKPTGFWAKIYKHRYTYLLVMPGFLFFVVFKFGPMWGLILAFQNYNPYQGVMGSEWIGLENFKDLFNSTYFYLMLRNTLVINLLNIIFFFPIPIFLAIMLNEVRHDSFKKINQTIVYLPHFLSWVVIASITFFIFSADVGAINKVLGNLGFEPISFLTKNQFFWGLLTLQNIWKDAGWGTIIFLAAIAGVDPQRYEAAVIDGANRMRQIYHITLPAIRPTIIILLILRMGHMVDVGFEQVLLMMNPLVNNVAEVFDTYAYNQGVLRGRLSVGVTVGMFKGVVGLILIVIANQIAKRLGNEGIY